MDSSGDLHALNHPAGSSAWWGSIQAVFFPVLGARWLASLAGQVVSSRRSSGERRLQLKWLLGGSAIAVAGGMLGVPCSNSPDRIWHVIGSLGIVAVLALPLSMGVAILKYRLYDISARVQDAVGMDAAQADLLSVVRASLEPAHVSVWLDRDHR